MLTTALQAVAEWEVEQVLLTVMLHKLTFDKF